MPIPCPQSNPPVAGALAWVRLRRFDTPRYLGVVRTVGLILCLLPGFAESEPFTTGSLPFAAVVHATPAAADAPARVESQVPFEFTLTKATAPPRMDSAGPGLIWKVEGGHYPVYLAGSVHYGPSGGWTAWPAEFEVAWQDCVKVVFEVDPTEVRRPAQAAAVRELGQLPSGSNLWRLASPEVVSLLDGAARTPALRHQLAGMRPWLAALTLHEEALRRQGADRDRGFETLLADRARRERKKTAGLVSPRRQIESLASLDPAAQMAFLHSTLLSLSSARKELEAMNRAWRTGDLPWLERTLTEAFVGNPESYRNVMVERNRHWARVVEEMTRKGPATLVVVGCLHLAGEDSLRHFLAARGLSVTSIRIRKPLPAPASGRFRETRTARFKDAAAADPASAHLQPRVPFPTTISYHP